MRLSPNFYYEGAAGETEQGGGGAPDAKQKVDTTVNLITPILSADNIKEYGFDSEEEAKEFLRQRKENAIPIEEKKKAEDLDKANFIKYSTENNLIAPDEISKYESLKAKADRDLVFENYLSAWKEENPDIKEDIEKIAKEEFESEYKLDSANEKSKSRGEARLAKEASEIRNPFSTKYESASKAYAEAKKDAAKIPAYNQFMEGLVEKLTPEKLVLYKAKEGETEIPIEVELTKAERAEILKDFRNSKNFVNFITTDKPAELEAKLTKKINTFLRDKYFETSMTKAIETGRGLGVKKGSTAGAENPFALVKEAKSTETKHVGLEESNAKVAQARQRVRG